jgi:hypothetical protein
MENYVGEVTKYVVSRAPCRVIVTAPPADWQRRERPADGRPVEPEVSTH